MEIQQLQALSLEELKAYKVNAEQRKTKLEALKAEGGKAWNEKLQDELNEIALLLVDVEDTIEEKSVPAPEVQKKYVVAPGTENMVHLEIVHGRRFNPMTGKEESPVYKQLFTFAEWQLFKQSHRDLGYIIKNVLHDPYGEANKFVQQ